MDNGLEFFKDKMEKVKSTMGSWLLIEEKEDELVVQNPNNIKNRFYYSKYLNKKMMQKVPNGKFVYGFEVIKDGEIVKEAIVYVHEHKGVMLSMIVRVKYEKQNPVTFEMRKLDENWYFSELYYPEGLEESFEKFQEEIKSWNKYRLYFVYA